MCKTSKWLTRPWGKFQIHMSQGRSQLLVLGMGNLQPLIGNPYNGDKNPYYWVDDHPLLYGNNVSLDPSTYREPLRVLSPLLLTHRIQAKTCFIKKFPQKNSPKNHLTSTPPTLNPPTLNPPTTHQVTHVSLTTGSSDRFTSTQNQATTQTLNLGPTTQQLRIVRRGRWSGIFFVGSP